MDCYTKKCALCLFVQYLRGARDGIYCVNTMQLIVLNTSVFKFLWFIKMTENLNGKKLSFKRPCNRISLPSNKQIGLSHFGADEELCTTSCNLRLQA